jgi:hypothetical protein
MRGCVLAISIALAASASAADPVPRTPVADARPVMLAALQAADGQAHGVLTGEVAEAITRLKVSFRQEGVRLPGAPAPRTQTMDFGINYCLDGLPPKSLR